MSDSCGFNLTFAENPLTVELLVDGISYLNRTHSLFTTRILRADIPRDAAVSLRVHTPADGWSESLTLPGDFIPSAPGSGGTFRVDFHFNRRKLNCTSVYSTTSLVNTPTEYTQQSGFRINYPVFAVALVVVVLAGVVFLRGRTPPARGDDGVSHASNAAEEAMK